MNDMHNHFWIQDLSTKKKSVLFFPEARFTAEHFYRQQRVQSEQVVRYWKCRDDPYARLSARALTFRMEELNYVETLKFIVVCLMWYICSAGGNIIGKLVLNQFPFPMTVTMTQLVSISVYMEPIFWFLQTPNTGNIPRSYYFKLILPLAFGKFFSSVSSHISMWKSTVSYAHTGNRRTLYGGPFYTHWHIEFMKVTI